MRIGVVGAGYVGLASALVWSHLGHEVRLLERDPRRVESLRRGDDPLGEPLVPELLRAADLRVTSDAREALRGVDAVAIAVGTPPAAAGRADLSALEVACGTIARAASPCPVLVRSTVPVGTGDRLQRDTLRRFAVVSNPEFLREGRAIADMLRPDRVLAGGDDGQRRPVEELYAAILQQSFAPLAELPPYPTPRPLVWTDRRSAELAKYAANAFLATKLSFVNELANVAATTGSDIRSVIAVLKLDPRIGDAFLRPGIGWGGSCFPKDTRALAALAMDGGYEFNILRAVIDQNRRQLDRFLELMDAELAGRTEVRIGLLGLAFKGGTADCRESPALALAQRLVARGWTVRAYDPAVRERPAGLPDAVEIACDIREAALGADAIAIATEWDEFARDLAALREVTRDDLLFDGRCLVDPAEAVEAGFRYFGICPAARQ